MSYRICIECGNRFDVEDYGNNKNYVDTNYCPMCYYSHTEENHFSHIAYLYRQVQYNRGYEFLYDDDTGTFTKRKRGKE